MTSERRVHARRILYSPEYLDMGADNGGVVVNLSEGGLGFQTVSPVMPDAQLPISFSLGTGYRIDLKARVVWINEEGKIGGAAFGKLSKDSQSLIREWVAKQEGEHVTGHEDPTLDAATPAETRATLEAVQMRAAEAVPEGVSHAGEHFATEAGALAIEETGARNGVVLPTPAANPTEAAPDRFSELASAPAAAASSHPASQAPETSFPDTRTFGSNHPWGEPSRRAPEPAHNDAVAANFQRPAAPASHPPERKHDRDAASSFSAIPSISVWDRKGASVPSSPALSRDRAISLPAGRHENIFARRSDGVEPEPERKNPRTLIVVAIVIAVAAVVTFYVRTHRQQVGDAIAHIGGSIAGRPSTNSSALATAAPAAPVSTANSQTSPSPQLNLPAAQNSPAKTQPPNPAQSTSIPIAPKQSASSVASSSATSAPPISTGGGHPAAATPQSAVASPNKALAQPSGKPPSPQTAHDPSKNQNATLTPASSLLAAQSEYQRAEQYLNGTGVTQDYAQAAQWFWRSLEAGYTDAALPLANLYLEGNGVSRSCTQARILLDAAAQKNNAQAIHQLAQLPDNCQ